MLAQHLQAALAALDLALPLAAWEGFVLMFVDGRVNAPLLQLAVAQQVEPIYAAWLLNLSEKLPIATNGASL
jgi:hypothetical protein